jgi:hypothetical protein
VSEPSWSRAPLPWRATLGRVVVAAAEGEPVLQGGAAAMWDLLDEPRTTADLVTLARGAFGLDEAETTAALDSLREAGLCRST